MTLEDPREMVDRFHRVLVREIRSSAPRYLREPFTVAEIYQHLVPYRSHRDAIGVEMNADYEDALLRFLAGQGGYARLESEAAVRKIRKELESQNPDTGLYREYAAVEVRLNPEHLPGDGSRASVAEAEEPAPRAEPSESSGPPEARECRSCGSALPEREDLVYCPRCGADQRSVSCPACGTELEPGWRFCVACGETLDA